MAVTNHARDGIALIEVLAAVTLIAVAAVAEASGDLRPVSVAAGHGSIYLGHNRRRVDDSGHATMFWRNAERAPTSPVLPSADR